MAKLPEEPVSSHIDEYKHVFNNLNTTARLHVDFWNKETVADGNWQNENTIKPLYWRDLYLAECIEDLSAKEIPTYVGGDGIKIENNIVSVTGDARPKEISGIYPISVSDVDGIYKIGLNYDSNTLGVSSNKLYIKTDNINETLSGNSAVSSYTKHITQESTYEYTTAHLDLEVTSTLTSFAENKLYILG